MSWESVEKKIEEGPRGLAWMVFLGIMLAGLIIGGSYFIFKPAVIIGKVTNPDKVIQGYEYFYNQSQAYNAIKAKIVTANKSVTNFKEDAGPRDKWTFEDKTELSRLRSIADGLAYQCNDIVADYNAKAQQVTRSIFKTNSTPYKLQECN